MKKLLISAVLGLTILSSENVSAQYHDRFDRAGLFASLGVNNISGFVESKTGIVKSLKGNMSVMPVVGGFYELAIDKNLSMTFSGGLGLNTFSYSYSPENKTVGYIVRNPADSSAGFDLYPEGPAAAITRSYATLMLLPQVDLNLMTNPMWETTILEFRFGLGAGIYLSSHKNVYGDVFHAQDEKGTRLSYYFVENMEMGKGNRWASTYGSLYIGTRWRNTTSNFLNRSTLGVQIFMPFDNYRVGGTEISYYALGWEQKFQTESVKFKLNTISLKYSFSFTPTSR